MGERRTEIDLDLYDKGAAKLQEALISMGYTSLRQGQKEPINCVLMGRDTFCILPTGQGKSLTFAAPTKAMGWRTVVFSPLIALMHDQVQSMNRKGIRTAALNSAQAEAQNVMALESWIRGDMQMLYVAPERLSNDQFLRAMTLVKPDFVVLDEAHCMSQWSATFRPAYSHCGDFVEQFQPRVVMALTATATKDIIEDVKNILRIPNACICRYYPARANLHLSSSYIADQKNLFPAVLKKVREVSGSVIVYCSTVKELTNLFLYLQQAGESVTFYHGQMTRLGEKELNMSEFMSGRARIVVATNAFGMGIDKPDIEAVIHASPPNSVEAISQETGRAARDGRDAICHMFYTQYGLKMQEFFFNMSNPESSMLTRVYEYLERKADENGDAYVLVKELVEKMQDTGAEGAVNYLQTLGCVERINPPKSMYTICVVCTPDEIRAKENARSKNKYKYQADIASAIIEGGEAVGTTSAGYTVYKVDLEYIAKRSSMPESSVKTRLTDMNKENSIAIIETPFKGKITHLVRRPTRNDLIAADMRRKLEHQKIKDVRTYLRTDDKLKQEFLQEYFAV